MFSVVLSSILDAHKRSASWLAGEVGRSPASVLRWTAGETAPERDMMPAIRAALAGTGVSTSDLAALDRAYLGYEGAEVADG